MKSLILISILLTGCANTYSGYASTTTPQYVKNTQGQTVAKIQDGNVYTTSGVRTARIDSTGNIYNTSGVRVGRISK
jgi:PBP1b-binding outer membrane lipoprotein LpoB